MEPRSAPDSPPDPIHNALAKAFQPGAVRPPAPSVLAALVARAGSSLGVHIDSTGPGDVPVRVTDEARALRDPAGRYHVLGEIGRGGVGVVYKGRDNDLGRDVAMKVLKDQFADRPDVLARFVEEAQIGGQLQHPGIVPVYELGLHAGERPYFAMKLVKGETLSAQLAKRAEPGEDRRRFYGIFEQVCQTMAYAHSRHVVHRDLKPANVMIGAFGEVQVVDWGFAKVLAKGGNADEKASVAKHNESAQSVISTVRSQPGSGTQSVVGSMLGTPAYMPPEQALGDLEHLDARSDVFGLGAILCEILTGAPPYRERDGDVVRQAAAGDLDGAHERIRRSGADATMIALCIECLSRTRQARPASAQELADRVSTHLTSVEERARDAELRATRARFKQRTTLLSAAAALLVVVIGGVAWFLVDAEARKQQQAATARLTAATSDLREARGRAQAAGLDPELWSAAGREAERLAHLVDGERKTFDDDDRRTALALVDRVRAEHEAASSELALRERDREMHARLVTARIPTDDDVNAKGFAAKERLRLNEAYLSAFAFYLGRPIRELSTEAALASMREGEMESELAASLDHLSMVRDALPDQEGVEPLTLRLRELATLLDSDDAWRTQLRALLPNARGSAQPLRELAATADFGHLTATHCQMLSTALVESGARDEAIFVLQRAREQFPQDFGLTFALAVQEERRKSTDWQAVASTLDIARAIAPQQNEVLHRQGMALERQGRHADAERVFRILVARDARKAHWQRHIAYSLCQQGKLDEGIACYERALELDPDDAKAHCSLGIALLDQGKLDEAVASHRRAIELDPDGARAHFNLGVLHRSNGDFSEALASFQRAWSIWSPRQDAVSVDRAERAKQLIEDLQQAPRLLAIARGEQEAESEQEWFAAAESALLRKDHLGAVRTYTRAFAAFPESVGVAGHAYNAACAAALAASADSQVAARSTDAEKAALRARAHSWLAGDLKRWSFEAGADATRRAEVTRTLGWWQQDGDLAAVRDPRALASLPDEEAEDWRALWRDVAATLNQWEDGR